MREQYWYLGNLIQLKEGKLNNRGWWEFKVNGNKDLGKIYRTAQSALQSAIFVIHEKYGEGFIEIPDDWEQVHDFLWKNPDFIIHVGHLSLKGLKKNPKLGGLRQHEDKIITLLKGDSVNLSMELKVTNFDAGNLKFNETDWYNYMLGKHTEYFVDVVERDDDNVE